MTAFLACFECGSLDLVPAHGAGKQTGTSYVLLVCRSCSATHIVTPVLRSVDPDAKTDG